MSICSWCHDWKEMSQKLEHARRTKHSSRLKSHINLSIDPSFFRAIVWCCLFGVEFMLVTVVANSEWLLDFSMRWSSFEHFLEFLGFRDFQTAINVWIKNFRNNFSCLKISEVLYTAELPGLSRILSSSSIQRIGLGGYLWRNRVNLRTDSAWHTFSTVIHID